MRQASYLHLTKNEVIVQKGKVRFSKTQFTVAARSLGLQSPHSHPCAHACLSLLSLQ